MLSVLISTNSAEVKDCYPVYTAGGKGLDFFKIYPTNMLPLLNSAQLNISPLFPILTKEQDQSQIWIAGVEMHVDIQPTVLAEHQRAAATLLCLERYQI